MPNARRFRDSFVTKHIAPLLALACVLAPAPAFATDDNFEVWTNPRFTTALDKNTELQLETAQRFRDAGDGGVDTYGFDLWVIQKLDDTFTAQFGVERRFNDGGADETRLQYQLSAKTGIWRARGRIEQRFVDGNGGRMGVRARFRGGVSVPLDNKKKLSGFTDLETFFTLRATSKGGDDGFTGFRTRIGAAYKVSKALTVNLAYLRQQDVRSNRIDRVGHAPFIGLDFTF
jgi:opacity protein-like surface antigen